MRMRNLFWTLVCVIAMTWFAAGCTMFGSSGDEPEPATEPKSAVKPAKRSRPAKAPAKTVYLKNNIHAQDQRRGGQRIYRASYANWVNPGLGHFILPVNTKVKIGKWRGGFTIINLSEGGQTIHFELNTRSLRMSVNDYIDLITSPAKVALSKYSSVDRKGISKGDVYKGMTRDGVRMALGYPAPHKTPSLEENTWIYWQNRYKTLRVEFNAKGNVERIWK